MKKQIITGTVFATMALTSFADGVFGNQVSGSVGYPFLSDVDDYSGFVADLEFDYFLNENIYLTGGLDVMSTSFDIADSEIKTTYFKTGIGAGYEKTMIDDGNKQVATYGEGRIYLLNAESEGEIEIFGVELDMSASSTGVALDVEAGVRAEQSKLLSELGLKLQTVNIDSDNTTDLYLDAMVGYKVSDSLYVGVDTSLALDFDQTNLSAKIGYQW